MVLVKIQNEHFQIYKKEYNGLKYKFNMIIN